MAKRKYPSELNTRTVRAYIGDKELLHSLSIKHRVTVAEVIHKLIARGYLEEPSEASAQQAEMEILAVARPSPLLIVPRTNTISVERRVQNG